MLYSTQAEDLVGNFPQFRASPFDDHDLETVVVIEVHVGRGENFVLFL